MPRPGPDSLRLAEVFRLAHPDTPRSGAAGERLGRGTGASLEFQDRQAYVPGDDVRHLDWRALARTDQLWVRLYREEVMPRLELLVDGSRSMQVDEAKAARAVDLTSLLCHAARSSGFELRLWFLGTPVERVPWDALEQQGWSFDEAVDLPAALEQVAGQLRHGSLRILLSDFLFPHQAASVVRPLAQGAAGLTLLQLLAAQDSAPQAGVAARLRDVETGAFRDLVLEEGVVKQYQRRLDRLQEELARECRRAGGRFVSLSATGSLESQCRERLVPHVLEAV